MSNHSETYTSSQKRPNKTEWSASIEADKGYLPGRLNKENGILKSDTSIYASESIDNILYILVDQYNHQHIRVTINNTTVYENSRVIKCSIDDSFKAEIIPDTGYTINGELNETKGKLFKNKHLSVDNDAEPKMCEITMPATTNQTLVFYSMYTIQKSGSTSKTFMIPYDTEYSIEITPEYGYNKGTSNHKELTMYKLNTSSNSLMNKTNFSLNITCTNAVKKKYTITIPKMDNETVSVIANGTTYTNTVSLDYLTEYKVTITPKDKTYAPGRLVYPPVEIDSNIPTKRSFILTKDVNLSVTPAYKINDGVFYLQYLDGNRETVALSDYTDDDWYFKEPYILTNLDHNNKEDLYYLPFSGTAKSGFKDIDDTNSYDYIHDKTGIAPPSIKYYNINIVQSANQIIQVKYLGYIYTSSFKVLSGDSITCNIIPASKEYKVGKLNYTKIDNINQDYTISATAATYIPKKKYTITITQTANQTITVYSAINKQSYTSTFEATEGDTLNISITSSTGYLNGNVLLDGNVYTLSELNNIDSNHTISATSATAIKYTLTINQSNHQTISVTANGNTYTSTVSLPYGTKWTATIKADSGYKAGTLSKTSGTITANDIISATSAIVNGYTLTITQSANQTITVHANSKEYTSSVLLPYGTKWTATIAANTGYTAGTLNKTSGSIVGDDSIYASAATLNSYSITIVQKEHTITTVTATYNGSSTTFTSGVKTFPYGTTFKASTEGRYGYTAGAVNMSSGTLTKDISIFATSVAKLKSFTLTIVKFSHQTITVTANGNNYTSSTSLQYGTKWTATIKADEGYNAGTLNISSGTLTGDITVKATDATIKSFTLKITQSAHQTITVTANGKTYTSDAVLPYGTKWKADFTHVDNGYTPGNLNKTSGTIFNNDSVYASAAEILKYTITAVQLSNTAASLYAIVNNTKYKTSSFNYGTSYKVRFELTIPIISATMYINNTAIPSTIGYDSNSGYYYALSNNSYNLTSNVTIKVANVTGRIPKIGYVTDIT